MSLVPMKVNNKELYSALRTRILPLALIGVLFAKVIQLEKENADLLCNHVKSELKIDELENAIDKLRKQMVKKWRKSILEDARIKVNEYCDNDASATEEAYANLTNYSMKEESTNEEDELD